MYVNGTSILILRGGFNLSKIAVFLLVARLRPILSASGFLGRPRSRREC